MSGKDIHNVTKEVSKVIASYLSILFECVLENIAFNSCLICIYEIL
jgi:hypothetical protein